MERDDRLSTSEADLAEVAYYARQKFGRRLRIEFVLKAYVMFGLIIAVAATLYFVLSFMALEMTPPQQVALIAAGSGVALSFMSWLLLAYRRQIENYETAWLRESLSTTELLNAWASFENTSRQILQAEGDKFNRYSLRSIISTLYDENWITDQDLRSLQEALEMRNMVVHGRRRVPPNAISEIVDELAEIIAKLSKKQATFKP